MQAGQGYGGNKTRRMEWEVAIYGKNIRGGTHLEKKKNVAEEKL